MCVFCLGLDQTQKKILFINLIQTLSKIGKINYLLFYLRCNKIGVSEREGRDVKDDHHNQDYFLEKIDIQILLRYNL